jgi:PAS domain S-box-containing protein
MAENSRDRSAAVPAGDEGTDAPAADSGQRLLEALFGENSLIAVEGLDEHGAVRFWNAGAERLFGWSSEEALGRQLEELMLDTGQAAELLEELGTLARGRTSAPPREWPFSRRDGSGGVTRSTLLALPFPCDGIRSLRFEVEVTRRVRAEAEVGRLADSRQARDDERRSERLAAIGTFAAGIAHEINNPLGLIQLEIESALAGPDPSGPAREAFAAIQDDLQRCKNVVQQLLRFARQEPLLKRPCDMNEVAARAHRVTRKYAELRGVGVELAPAAAPAPVLGSSLELEQVLVNLIYNAVHASGEGAAITIAILEHAGSIVAEVRDEGCGMSAAVREHAFDPFFTTRQREGGTGLGLSTCHGIVREHGGHIDLESREGRGTTVRVRLPGGSGKPAGDSATGRRS